MEHGQKTMNNRRHSPPSGDGGLALNRYATAAISRKKKGLTENEMPAVA
jgi:hypothetical protein